MKMKGWKTWAGGLGQIATGAGILFNCIQKLIAGDILTGEEVAGGFILIFTGFTTIGIGHKIEKGKNEGEV